MIRWAPAAILRARRSHSVTASAAVGSSAQAIVNAGPLPIGDPAASSPRLSRPGSRRGRSSPRPRRRSPRVVADPRRVAGQGEDVADAQRMGTEQLRFERHEVPVARRHVDDALEVEVVLDPERHGQRAHPDAGHRRVADVDDVDAGGLQEPGRLERALDADRARRVDLDGDDVAARRERPGETGRRRRPSIARRLGAGAWIAVGAAGRRSAAGRRRPAVRASIARRIAAMCSGVVPQQPPTMAAPASSMSPTIRPK